MRYLVPLALLPLAGCASTPPVPDNLGGSAFEFRLSPEACMDLEQQRRTYRATEKTAGYVSGIGAILAGILVVAVDKDTAPAIATGATVVATGVGVFSGSQVTDLDDALAAGRCGR